MPVGIAAMALMGIIFWTSMAAILLGAVLAPTDPVLAAKHPSRSTQLERQEDVTRFTLTSEGGLNDGLAFPFVYLAIAIATAASPIRVLVQKIGCIGWVMMCYGESLQGWLRVTVSVSFGKLAIYQAYPDKVEQSYMVLALMLLAYSITEFVHGYGFIAVFVAALTFRRSECEHKYHEGLHDFAEQIEGLLMSLVMVFLGLLVGQALASDVTLAGKCMWYVWRLYFDTSHRGYFS